MGRQIQATGFYLCGFLCLVLAVLKLTAAVHWSWWRVWLPIRVVLGHNGLYIAVGFMWLCWIRCGDDTRGATIRQSHRLDGYQLAGMLCLLIFVDNLLRRIGEPGESVWCWLASGRMEVIFLCGALSLTCQFLFWSGIVRPESGGFHRQRGAKHRDRRYRTPAERTTDEYFDRTR